MSRRYDYSCSFMNKAMAKQEGGSHYKDYNIQPVQFIYANNVPFIEGNIIKYVMRHRNKNGLQDLLKAKHYIDLLIDLEYNQNLENENQGFIEAAGR